MAFVDGDDSGQKMMGVDFGIPFTQFAMYDWPMMVPEARDRTELFFIYTSLPCLLFGIFHVFL